jgi:class 3 adenylate cyclase
MIGDTRSATLGAPTAARHLVTQRFRDPQVEAAFQADAGARFRQQVVATILLGAATWAATGVLLLLLFRVNPLRTVAAISLIELVIFASYAALARARTWDQVQTLSALVNLAGGLGIIVIGAFVVELPHLVAAALVVNLLFAFGLSRFGPIGVAVTAPYVLVFAFLVIGGGLPSVGLFEVFLVGVGFAVSSMGGYLLEASTRGIFWQRRIIEAQAAVIAEEKEKSERLVHNMLPRHIAAQLLEGKDVAERLPDVSVLFADLVGFTPLSSKLPPDSLISVLDELFSRFDELAGRHGLEKIKTIGDAYMAVAGAIEPTPDHAERTTALGLDMLDTVAEFAAEVNLDLQLRVGINSGPVVAGVIGRARYSYDLWGDTVNVASRMESQGVPGAVHVSAATASELGDAFELEPTGMLDVKGKGLMKTYLVRRPVGVALRRELLAA